MYLAASTPSPVESLDAPSAAAAKPKVYYERISSRWEVGFALSDGDSFQQVSFANSIATIKGGTHVDLIATQLTDKL
jgi:DNA topoisomerase-2